MDPLREHMRGHMAALSEGLGEGNIVSLARRRSQDVELIELVNQAAATIKAREERAAHKEQQALDVASRAVEQLAGAERKLRETIDAAQRSEAQAVAAAQMIAVLDAKARQLETVLTDAQSLIDVLRRQLAEAQARAEDAELRATEANNKLSDVSYAIRAKLMGHRDTEKRRTAA